MAVDGVLRKWPRPDYSLPKEWDYVTWNNLEEMLRMYCSSLLRLSLAHVSSYCVPCRMCKCVGSHCTARSYRSVRCCVRTGAGCPESLRQMVWVAGETVGVSVTLIRKAESCWQHLSPRFCFLCSLALSVHRSE